MLRQRLLELRGLVRSGADELIASARAELDGYAIAWLLARKEIPRQGGLELLERLAVQFGAKLELPDAAV